MIIAVYKTINSVFFSFFFFFLTKRSVLFLKNHQR